MALNANQYANILNLFNGTARHQVLGLVWSDAGDRRLEGNPVAERAFRRGEAQADAGPAAISVQSRRVPRARRNRVKPA